MCAEDKVSTDYYKTQRIQSFLKKSCVINRGTCSFSSFLWSLFRFWKRNKIYYDNDDNRYRKWFILLSCSYLLVISSATPARYKENRKMIQEKYRNYLKRRERYSSVIAYIKIDYYYRKGRTLRSSVVSLIDFCNN